MGANLHFLNCPGDGERPCSTGIRPKCDSALFHEPRCQPCRDRAHERILFGRNLERGPHVGKEEVKHD